MTTMDGNATIDDRDCKWMMFDGPVDAIWIEYIITVLDDKMTLCLNIGKIIKIGIEITMMFEVQDVTAASPATVSRVSIISMEPHSPGLNVLQQSWLEQLPSSLPVIVKSKNAYLFDSSISQSVLLMLSHLMQLSPAVDNNMAEFFFRIFHHRHLLLLSYHHHHHHSIHSSLSYFYLIITITITIILFLPNHHGPTIRILSPSFYSYLLITMTVTIILFLANHHHHHSIPIYSSP